MTERFEVQARLQRRHEGRVVHDESRHAFTDNVDDARRAASMLVADGFTVWIFGVTLDGSRPTYRSSGMMRPNSNGCSNQA